MLTRALLLASLALVPSPALAQEGTVSVPLDRWETMLDQLRAEDEQPPAPVAVLHLDRSVEGSFQRGVFSGTLRVRLLVPPGQEHNRVPVIGADCSVGQVLLNGKQTSLLLDGEQYTVGVPGPGVHALELRFFQGREDDRFRRQLALSLPPAGPTALSIWLPESGVDATLAQGALVGSREEAGGTRITGQLDGRADLDLSWKRLVQDQPLLAAKLEAEVETIFTLQEALVQGVTAVEWQLSEGEADRFTLSLPADLEVLDVTGDAVLQWYSAPPPAGSEGPGRLTVLLRYVVTDQASVRVHFQFPMDLERTLVLRMPVPVLPEGTPLRGHLGVQGPAGLGVTVEKAEGVTTLDARELPPSLLDLAGRPLLLGFDLTGAPEIALAVKRQADLVLTDTLIDDVQASTLLLEDGTEVGKLRLRLRNSTRQYLSATLPPGSTLTHARIDGRPVRPAVSMAGDVESLLFPLQQSERLRPGVGRTHLVAEGETLSGIAALYDARPGFWLEILEANRDQLSTVLDLSPGQTLVIPTADNAPESSFIIELAYKRAQAPVGLLGHRALTLPSLDVDVVSTTWHLYLPDSVLPFGFQANLSQTSHLRYDPIRRLLYFLDGALGVRSAWAGGDRGWESKGSYESILSQRRGLYRAEIQSKASAGEVLSSFPFTGTQYSFERLLPGQETAEVGFYWVDRDGVPLLRWAGLIAAFTLTLRALRGQSSRARIGLAVLGLLLVAHVIPGVHRRLLWGLDLALLWDLYTRVGRAWLASALQTPPSLRGMWRQVRPRDVVVIGALGLSLWALTLFPLLASTLVAALLLGARRSVARVAAPLVAPLLLLGLFTGSPARAEDMDAADAAAEAQFDSILSTNLGYVDGGELNNAPARAAPPSPPASVAEQTTPALLPPAPEGATAEVPLSRYEAVRDATNARADRPPQVAPVVLGSSVYTGAAQGGVLALNLRLGVTLAGPGRWKMVPVIGEEVVIVRAQAGGQPIPLSTRDGYHVWVTQQSGEVELSVDLLVPPKGPKGSLEYDFLAAKTPVTRFSAVFPVPGLEPRLRNTVRATVTSTASSTALDANLSSSSRVHLVGYRDLGEEEGQSARIYAESLNLLSLGEDALELFTVFRYSILYAGAREFQIFLPDGWTLVSAEGEGAFRHTLEPAEGGQLLRGETAFPVRNSFEVSLRLRRALPESGAPFGVPLPRGLGLERQYGWLAAEVNGNLLLESQDPGGALPVDVRQLPYAVVESAVSPLLMAWRVLDPATTVKLAATAMPEKEPASGSIDKVEAISAVSAEGTALTELRITLRNRLRHSLALRLPEGARVRTAFLDDEPVVPSQSADGAVLFPLKRSDGGDRPEAFTLVVVLESQGPAFGMFGLSAYALPTLDLPVSSLSWTLRLPARNRYSRLFGDVEPQRYNGRGVWYQPSSGALAENPTAGPMDMGGAATPIEVEIPTGGTELTWNQYWVGADQPVSLSVLYLQGWLRGPLALLLAAGLVLGLARSWATRALPRALPIGTPRVQLGVWLAITGLAVVALQKLGGDGAVLLSLLAGLGLGLLRRPGVGTMMRWVAGLFRLGEQSETPKTSLLYGFLLRCALLAALGVLGIGVLGLLFMLPRPLGG